MYFTPAEKKEGGDTRMGGGQAGLGLAGESRFRPQRGGGVLGEGVSGGDGGEGGTD